MSAFITGLLFLLGLLLIVKGGDWFLDGAVWMAEASGIPRFLIGATVVSLATTLPELTVSVTGVRQGAAELAVGNAIGSVTANLGLILGLSVCCIPARVSRLQFGRKAALMVCSAALLSFLCREGRLDLVPALLLLPIFLLYFAGSVGEARRSVRRRAETARHSIDGERRLWKFFLFAAGMGAILVGSRLLIVHGSNLACLLGVPAGVIGAVMVGVGTSLPELVTTVTAILRGEAALSVGNIIGANIIDLTLILPLCVGAVGGSLPIGSQTTGLDLPVCLGLCVFSALSPLVTGGFARWQGLALLGSYAAYLAVLLF